MYTIYADDNLLYSPNIEDVRFLALEPKLTVELNKAGSLEFKLPPGNIKYNSIQKLKSVLTVYYDEEEMWRGRVLSSDSDFYRRKDIYAEGELAYMLDSKVRPYQRSGGVADYFNYLINQHNEQVDEFKRFVVGSVTVTDKDNNDCIVRANKNYPDTFSEITDKLLNNLGGYLKVRKVGSKRYIDYLADSGKKSDQVIQFGVNLLDLSEYINAEDVFTVLIPLGAQSEDEAKDRLTISSVNGGKDYIEDETAIKLFGRITKTQTWDDVTLPDNLLRKGKEYLKTGIEMAVTLTIKAVDLVHLGVNTEKIKLGEYIRVVSIPHDIDTYFLCSKIVYNLENPSKTEYTLGVSFYSLTDRQAESLKSSSTVLQIAESASAVAASAVTIAEEAKDNGADKVSKTEFNKYKDKVGSDYAKKTDVPTKISQLENDANYINQETYNSLESRVKALEQKE